MTPFEETKQALEHLLTREKVLKQELKEIENTKLKIAYMLGGGEIK